MLSSSTKKCIMAGTNSSFMIKGNNTMINLDQKWEFFRRVMTLVTCLRTITSLGRGGEIIRLLRLLQKRNLSLHQGLGRLWSKFNQRKEWTRTWDESNYCTKWRLGHRPCYRLWKVTKKKCSRVLKSPMEEATNLRKKPFWRNISIKCENKSVMTLTTQKDTFLYHSKSPTKCSQTCSTRQKNLPENIVKDKPQL